MGKRPIRLEWVSSIGGAKVHIRYGGRPLIFCGRPNMAYQLYPAWVPGDSPLRVADLCRTCLKQARYMVRQEVDADGR